MVYFMLMAAAVPSFYCLVFIWSSHQATSPLLPISSMEWFGFIAIFICWILLLGLEYWLVADNRRKKWHVTPRHIHRQCKKYPYIPAVSLAVLTLVMFTGWLIACMLGQAKGLAHMPIDLIKLLVLSAILIPGATVFGALASRCFSRRFLINFHERQICYECSYDMRGKPHGQCPECGFDQQTISN